MKILIANAWGGNRGDEAMINSLYRILAEEIPGAEIYVAPFRLETMDVLPQIRLINNRAGVYSYSPLTPLFAKLKKLPKSRFFMRPILDASSRRAASETAFPSRFDWIISAPQGPTISDMYDYKIKTLQILDRARKAGVPYGILGVSMGPFKDVSPQEKWVEEVLLGARGIVLREDLSLEKVLSKYPSLKGKLESYIDMVYATEIDIADKPQKDRAAYETFLASVPAQSIGACISLTPARDPKNPFDKDAYLAQMTAFFSHVLSKTGRMLYLFPHLENDVPYLKRIVDGLQGASKVKIMPREFDSEFQQDFLTKLEFFISSRYHPTIFAVKAGTPFMCVKNQFKVEGMLAKLGIAHESCWQDEPLETYTRVFDACWNDREAIAASVKRGREAAFAEARKYRDFIRTRIKGGSR